VAKLCLLSDQSLVGQSRTPRANQLKPAGTKRCTGSSATSSS